MALLHRSAIAGNPVFLHDGRLHGAPTQQALLVVSWALFITPFLGRCGYLIAARDKGWAITLDDIFNFRGYYYGVSRARNDSSIVASGDECCEFI